MKTESKEMAPHIRKTVAEIDGDINQLAGDIANLRQTRATLVNLYGGETELPDVNARDARAPRPQGAPRGDGVQVMAVARTAPEPFTAVSLAAASGCDKKLCSNQLLKFKVKGFVEKLGRGEFKRTGKFPAALE